MQKGLCVSFIMVSFHFCVYEGLQLLMQQNTSLEISCSCFLISFTFYVPGVSVCLYDRATLLMSLPGWYSVLLLYSVYIQMFGWFHVGVSIPGKCVASYSHNARPHSEVLQNITMYMMMIIIIITTESHPLCHWLLLQAIILSCAIN